MNKLIFGIALTGALVMSCTRESASERTLKELVIAEEERPKLKHTPELKIEETGAVIANLRNRIATLEDERKDYQHQMEPSSLTGDAGPVASDISMNHVFWGNYTIEDGVVFYSTDAQLRFGGVVLTSPSGVMLSDQEQTMFLGNLLLRTPQGEVEAEDGIISVKEGKLEFDSRGSNVSWQQVDGEP